MQVDDRQVPFSRPRIDSQEHERLSSGNVEQGKILRGRANENQVVILGIVERKKCAALHPDGTIQQRENMVKLVNGQHLSHAGVVIHDERSAVGGWIEVAHSSLRSADKAAVAEDNPGLLWPG